MCPLMGGCIKTMWYIYTREYYSALEKKLSSSFAATWMKLQDIIPSEVSLTKRDKYCMVKSEKKFEFIETERRKVVARG